MRIRWGGVAKVAAVLVVGLVGVRLLPGLLRAPEPPPLGDDVGLPRVVPAAEPRPVRSTRPVAKRPARRTAAGVKRRHRPEKRRSRVHPRKHAEKHAKPPPIPRPVVEPDPPPAPETTPVPTLPLAPEPVPEAPPEPSPAPSSTPGDGSEEFAPH